MEVFDSSCTAGGKHAVGRPSERAAGVRDTTVHSMWQIVRDFRVGRPQIYAGLMLLGFLAQCLWAAGRPRFSEYEMQFTTLGHPSFAVERATIVSPFTSVVASTPLKFFSIAQPRLVRFPFAIFGVWLGGALWWVARRLFDDAGGYVALALYCTSPAMIKISSNIGPEVLLAWSCFGLVYTAIGVAHTLYAPPRKWLPRIGVLGLSIGFALSTALWSFTVVLLAFSYMLYLAPERRKSVLVVLGAATAIGSAVFGALTWITGAPFFGPSGVLRPQPSLDLLRNLWYVLADGYVLVGLFILALTAYLSWPRARYFGNTAPLITGLLSVFLFTLVPGIHIWNETLGLSFGFIFVGGLAADFLETRYRLPVLSALVACFVLRGVLSLIAIGEWVHQMP